MPAFVCVGVCVGACVFNTLLSISVMTDVKPTRPPIPVKYAGLAELAKQVRVTSNSSSRSRSCSPNRPDADCHASNPARPLSPCSSEYPEKPPRASTQALPNGFRPSAVHKSPVTSGESSPADSQRSCSPVVSSGSPTSQFYCAATTGSAEIGQKRPILPPGYVSRHNSDISAERNPVVDRNSSRPHSASSSPSPSAEKTAVLGNSPCSASTPPSKPPQPTRPAPQLVIRKRISASPPPPSRSPQQSSREVPPSDIDLSQASVKEASGPSGGVRPAKPPLPPGRPMTPGKPPRKRAGASIGFSSSGTTRPTALESPIAARAQALDSAVPSASATACPGRSQSTTGRAEGEAAKAAKEDDNLRCNSSRTYTTEGLMCVDDSLTQSNTVPPSGSCTDISSKVKSKLSLRHRKKVSNDEPAEDQPFSSPTSRRKGSIDQATEKAGGGFRVSARGALSKRFSNQKKPDSFTKHSGLASTSPSPVTANSGEDSSPSTKRASFTRSQSSDDSTVCMPGEKAKSSPPTGRSELYGTLPRKLPGDSKSQGDFFARPGELKALGLDKLKNLKVSLLPTWHLLIGYGT